MDGINPVMARLAAAKEERRRRLAQLTFPEKVRIVVRLQRMAATVLKKRDRRACVWRIEQG